LARIEAVKSHHEIACEVGTALTSGLALGEALEVVARRITEALDVWECDIYEYYPDSETIVAATAWAREMTQEDRDWIGTVWSLDDRASYHRVLLDGVLDASYAGEGGSEAIDLELMDEWGELATLSVPLSFQGRVIGCFTLVEKREIRHFTDEDKELARLLAVPAAVAVHNARLFRRQEAQERQLASLLDSSRVLTSAVVLEDILNLVCQEAAAALETAEAVIYEYDAGREVFVFRAIHQGAPTDEALAQIGAEYDIETRPGDRDMLYSGEIVEDRVSDPGLDEYVRDSMVEWGEKTCLNVPLLFEGTPVGELILIESERERHFSPDETELARALGEQAAVAIVNARSYRVQKEQNRRLLALLETSRSLAASLDVETVLHDTSAAISELFGVSADAVGVTLRGDAAFDGVAREELGGAALAGGAPAQAPTESGARLVAPLAAGDQVEGCVAVEVCGRLAFADEDVEMVQILASQATAALANARLYRTVQEQAITDGLTGLYNHRYFYERLAQEFARAQRYGVPLSLLMLDIDDFKAFNDAYGHPAGDLALSEVGRILATKLRRDIDVAARYGGEEFAVLLPNTARDGAQKVGDRIVNAVASLPDLARAPGHPGGARVVGERIRAAIETASVPAAGGVSVTVSVGVGAHPAAGDPDELVREADKALYLAKRMGKNRVEVFVD
jgi:diguanylate cyclase (GGDEF)-like protein